MRWAARLAAGLAACLVLVGTALAQETRRAEAPPNIVILVADDMGYGDLGVMGAVGKSTPNIDRLAGEGVRLTSYYANHPVCSPSRAALLTGRYQHRFGFENNSGAEENTSPKFGIPATERNLAERLKPLGYAAGAVGKWHVGFRPEFQPTSRGFDSFYGFLGGAIAYTAARAPGASRMMRGTERVDMPNHTTEAFADEAVAFIDAHRDRPFLLYVAFNAIHSPMQSTDAYLARFASEPDPKRRAHLAQLAALDDAVGKIVGRIDEAGLGERTLVVFTSDNGGPTWETTASNGPLNGIKTLVLEGGIRVPAIFRWTGRLPAGRVMPGAAMGFDIPATALAAAGAKRDPALDGRDLTPWLTGRKSGDVHRELYWRSGEQGAIREGDWKLIVAADKTFLFNLRTDLGERVNLADQEPARVRKLRDKWTKWSDSMMKPAWIRNELAGGDTNRPKGLFARMIERSVAGEQVNLATEVGAAE